MLVALGLAHRIGFGIEHGIQRLFNRTSDHLVQVAANLRLIDANYFAQAFRGIFFHWWSPLVWSVFLVDYSFYQTGTTASKYVRKIIYVIVVNAVVETGAGVIEGDPGAIARGFATATEAVTVGGAAGFTAKVASQAAKTAINTATNGVKKVVDQAKSIGERLIEKLNFTPKNLIPGSQFRDLRPEGGGSFFDIPGPAPRGEAIEVAVGKNTPGPFKGIDRIDFDAKEAISIKSKDLTLPSFKTKAGLRNSIRADIRKLDRFEGAALGRFEVFENDFSTKTLELVIQQNKATSPQRDQILDAVEFAREREIELRLIEIP